MHIEFTLSRREGVSVTHVGQAMGSRDMEQKAIKMIQHKDFLLKRIQEKPVFQEMIENGTFEQVLCRLRRF